jgi:SAM-dependent methyltransferase
MNSVRFETRFTYDFICRSLPQPCDRILEIGCGPGELAAHLSDHGFQVTAIDCDEESIAAARRLGVNARVMKWPDFNDSGFDAVLFTRSLHHIRPIRDAVEAAAKCLRSGGRIIVEDFAHDSADERTLRWFASASRIVVASGLFVERHELIDEMIRTSDLLAAWRKHHDHDLNSAVEIAAELEAVFGSVTTERAAYYFRYLAKTMGDSNDRDKMTEALAQQEGELTAQGLLVPLGRRFVATRE